MLCWGDRLHTLSHQPYDGFQRDFLLLKRTVPFGRLLPFYRQSHPFGNHLAGLLSPSSLCFNQRPPLSVVHLCKEGWMKLLTSKAKSHLSEIRSTDLRLRIFALYLTASGVGLVPSQYQWIVLGFTNFAQVLSSGLVFWKIFLRKPNSSVLTCGHRLIAKEKDN